MNILSYGLLGLLTRDESSGYDLMLKIQPHWPAKHSQIYPLLSRMEEDELLSSRWIEQTDKPDKKMYTITDKGIQVLLEWMYTPVSTSPIRDELSLRLICFQITNPELLRQWIEERRQWYQIRQEYYEDLLKALPDEAVQPTHSYFGDYIVNTKAAMKAKAGMEWCDWVSGLISSGLAEHEASNSH
ncbi:PadR family transcriptional regulator [Paenibacillus sp. 453mf]|uniref:PadR family transcriptional regulator n=1 Tax=Paenibacillus sp. 453mf TaxID=1761874 RepID=UPI0008E6D786|nr:PadR family transcriptional regulator [Paenibacillus sp. 453mf]SFS58515.1 DNA-binding transcriptional regulator, PadR family [Paenibacillus sp. 453mf]